MDKDLALAQFQSFTATDDIAKALGTLEKHNWNLEA
jgi:hypothetical protein